MLCGLVPALRHARSLLCLHLESNPGINPTVQEYYQERLSILVDDFIKPKLPLEKLQFSSDNVSEELSE